ncbi:hypothetical protein OHD16_15205 [Sphingobacterium sp. ML3W]|uniref:hypothetical protein n=1 Tax=Sphingobacterium sp. ML3W TaxID=1538644 RepID=UPI00249AF236|nr:hypothetical protein [Sphingobacterium sp. ML3W]WFA81303.1 hypothetical protein OGI71_08350 [Sphingobacterium sp. ML3W]
MYKLVVLSLFLIGCTETKNKTSNSPGVMKDVVIKSIEVINTGGQLGFHSCIFIDKDSTHYRQTVAANPANNSEYHKKTVSQDWEDLTAKINLAEFRSSEEGKSVQPVDGIDTQVIVVSDAGTISKMNAYNNKIWKSIVEYVYHDKK